MDFWPFFKRESIIFLHQNEEDIKDQLDQISKALANAEQHTVVIIREILTNFKKGKGGKGGERSEPPKHKETDIKKKCQKIMLKKVSKNHVKKSVKKSREKSFCPI